MSDPLVETWASCGRVAAALSCLAAVVGCASIAVHSAATAAPALVVEGPFDQLGARAREPMIIQHPGGALFVAGYGEDTPTLWTSGDRGATWTRVDVGPAASGAIGNSDVDLAVARDGTLYFVTMVFDRQAFQGTHISIGVSKDVGRTWSWTLLSNTTFDDRPWVDVAPDGTAHVIWNDGNGVCHSVSRDSGLTWTERPRIHAAGGSSHLAVGPKGEVAVRVTPFSASSHKIHPGVDLVAVSTDGGVTWRTHPAPGHIEWTKAAPSLPPPPWWPPLPAGRVLPRWVEPLAWDARGALYSMWTDGEGVWLARSSDLGGRWTSWRVAESGGLDAYYPYLIARGRGEVAATWFSGSGDGLAAHVARIALDGGDGAPRSMRSAAFRPDSWRSGPSPEAPLIRDTAGEYLAVTFLEDGGLVVLSPIQNRAAQRFGFSLWRVAPEVR